MGIEEIDMTVESFFKLLKLHLASQSRVIFYTVV